MRSGVKWKKETVKIEILFLAQFDRMGKKKRNDNDFLRWPGTNTSIENFFLYLQPIVYLIRVPNRLLTILGFRSITLSAISLFQKFFLTSYSIILFYTKSVI